MFTARFQGLISKLMFYARSFCLSASLFPAIWYLQDSQAHSSATENKINHRFSFADIFISREQISIDNRIAIDQFRGCISDCAVIMQRKEFPLPREAKTPFLVTTPLFASLFPFSPCSVCRRTKHANAFRRRTSRGTFRVIWIHISVVYAPRYFRSDTSIRYLENFCIPSRVYSTRASFSLAPFRVWYKGEERYPSPSDLPSFLQAEFLFSSEIDLDAEQAGSTSDKFQWSVEVSILFCSLVHNFDVR